MGGLAEREWEGGGGRGRAARIVSSVKAKKKKVRACVTGRRKRDAAAPAQRRSWAVPLPSPLCMPLSILPPPHGAARPPPRRERCSHHRLADALPAPAHPPFPPRPLCSRLPPTRSCGHISPRRRCHCPYVCTGQTPMGENEKKEKKRACRPRSPCGVTTPARPRGGTPRWTATVRPPSTGDWGGLRRGAAGAPRRLLSPARRHPTLPFLPRGARGGGGGGCPTMRSCRRGR